MSHRPLVRVTRLLAIAVLVGLVASACGGASGGEDSPAAAEAPNASTVELLTGEFISVADGERVDLASYQGEDVLLWFWAPW